MRVYDFVKVSDLEAFGKELQALEYEFEFGVYDVERGYYEFAGVIPDANIDAFETLVKSLRV